MRTACCIICVDFTHTAVCVSELFFFFFFFLREREYRCLDICPVISLPPFYLVTDAISLG
jgi:hypothetical protein